MPTYHVSTNQVDDFGPGNEVIYVPIWVNGDSSHPDCETGVVDSTRRNYVLVKCYDKETGDLDEQLRYMNPEDLINMSES